jgi:pilus assembly protein Flp/PilA
MTNLIKRLVKEEEGQGLVEYALIIAFIAILLVGSLTVFKDELINAYSNAAHTFD